MRCIACDCVLSDRESTRKSSQTGQYLDLCDDCVRISGVSYTESIYRDELDKIERDTDAEE